MVAAVGLQQAFLSFVAANQGAKAAKDRQRAFDELNEFELRQQQTEQRGIREAERFRQEITDFSQNTDELLRNEIPLIESKLRDLEGGLVSPKTRAGQFDPPKQSGISMGAVIVAAGLTLLVVANSRSLS